MALLPYPTEAPPEAWQLVWDAIRTREVPRTAHAVHVGWNLAGFALNKVYPAGPIVIGAELTEHDESAVNAAFAQLCQPQSEPQAVSAIQIPWGLVLQALLMWLQNRK
jgi:hypothetical protein